MIDRCNATLSNQNTAGFLSAFLLLSHAAHFFASLQAPLAFGSAVAIRNSAERHNRTKDISLELSLRYKGNKISHLFSENET